MITKYQIKGVLIASTIVIAWFCSLIYLFSIDVSFYNPLIYLFIFVQSHLYTGLFITAHDAMHGTVSQNKITNKWIGRVTAILFAFNFYDKLFTKHHEHHRFVATDKDPDYHSSDNFFIWYFSFVKQYVTWYQILMMAITLNLLKIIIPIENLILFWMIPSIIATFQLFYFGTYLPHKGEHSPKNHQKSRSQKLNHFVAFITCYFFGYHYEHHISPRTPWWKLHKLKEKYDLEGYPN